MEIIKGKSISTLTPEELLGPLNDVEARYAPPRLYVAGVVQTPLPRPRVAVVGSRKASGAGLEAATQIARILARNQVVVVSGLAEGIDTAAHRATIEENGYTVAVLGTPLNRVYPAKNFELQDKIMREYCAVSQFLNGHPTQPRDFVIRDRTMALVCNASIIVEAGETSGSLAQGWEALRLGRPLYIWKLVLEKRSLSWPKKMMEYGAVALEDPKDILGFLPPRERIVSVAQ
ncbi:MAG: DNA-processing protein DprA [Nitrososphaerota archaeon]|jgi:DNA processing protein|nr:DNA-processing protein DprA [Nitrososphaerota archaeon]MDG6912483.1 DNA-processing protein DprA [Nitrososphaerota archaeon]MDG6921353.1 DNA-processing protein DprA [Nitrososphaerota archaeon]MDG6924889.1 DNA-processing protein DprA [Nitrososphaerota archaeon]MDG6949517.1 DNA-processing protein DprA [Nitrososphaerota archaeon]